MTDRIYTNQQRTILLTIWDNGTIELATRETPAHTWGPPTQLTDANTTVVTATHTPIFRQENDH